MQSCYAKQRQFNGVTYREETQRETDMIAIWKIREHPEMAEKAADWFHEKWHIPLESYQESIQQCLKNESAVPQWYLAMDEWENGIPWKKSIPGKIVGGMGVIENDFHDRKDLTPNVCAVYVEEAYRCQGIAGRLLKTVCADLAAQGIDTLYLVTDHTSFYERYGWEFLCMVQGDGETDLARMYVHRGYKEKSNLNGCTQNRGNMFQIVVIINGSGGVGKDTLCSFAGRKYEVANISSITPIKDIAFQHGWNGEKDSRSRKFLADLKKTFSEYNDLPFRYLAAEYGRFLHSSNQILFVHIREREEIDKFKSYVKIPCVTLLIRGNPRKEWGNSSDDDVENYVYDYIYDNKESLTTAESTFCTLLQGIIWDCNHTDFC